MRRCWYNAREVKLLLKDRTSASDVRPRRPRWDAGAAHVLGLGRVALGGVKVMVGAACKGDAQTLEGRED